MKNLLDDACRRELLVRFDRLSPDAGARWGRMNGSQMVCRVADPLRIALEELEVADQSSPLTRTLLRQFGAQAGEKLREEILA